MNNADKWSRRGLLTARGLGASTGGMLAGLARESDPFKLVDDRSIAHCTVTRRAMGCEFEIIASGDDEESFLAIAQEALDEVERAEYRLSCFIETSDVGRINAARGGEPVRVSPDTIEVLELARRLWEATDHAFDVTAGPLTRLWREARQRHRTPAKHRIAEALGRVGMQHVHTDADERTVWVDRAGIEIDLGAVGKGLGVDRAMETLGRYGIADVAVCGADSSMRVIGTSPGSLPGQTGWCFCPRNPLDTSRYVSSFRLREGAIGTSSQHEQHLRYGGRVFGHILDPRTGWPAAHDFATLVVAPSAVAADALATACLIMGPEKASELGRLDQNVSVAFIDCRGTPEEACLTWIVRSEDIPAEPETEVICRETSVNQVRRSENE